MTGDSRIDRPRGVRSASRTCARATAASARERPGIHVRRDEVSATVVPPRAGCQEKPSSRPNVTKPTPWNAAPAAASAASGRTALAASPLPSRGGARRQLRRQHHVGSLPAILTARSTRVSSPRARRSARAARSRPPFRARPGRAEQLGQQADQRQDEDEDAARSARRAADRGRPRWSTKAASAERPIRREDEEQRRRAMATAAAVNAPAIARPIGSASSSGIARSSHGSLNAPAACADVERAARDRQQQQPDGVRALHRRQQDRTERCRAPWRRPAGCGSRRRSGAASTPGSDIAGVAAEQPRARPPTAPAGRGDERADLLDGEREPLERVARAGALERVHQHAPAHPGERAQDASNIAQIQSSPIGARASPPTS